MEARNAAGRRVSLLNDDSVSYETSHIHHVQHNQQQKFAPGFPSAASRVLARPQPTPRSSSSSPNTPELWRSDSYDSQMSNDPVSPLTPSVDYAYPRGGLYGSEVYPKRPAYVDRSRATSYDDENTSTAASTPTAAPSNSARPAKRYPCRYRDTHGCEKTFTTSGHASRHSKIHTAEKAVQCTYPSCQKKFTRADNMKQHLETHYKDRNRTTVSLRVPTAPVLTEIPRPSTTGRSRSSTCNTSTSSIGGQSDAMQWESDVCSPSGQQRLPSPTTSSWGAHLCSNRTGAISPNSGLDALAMAVACQDETSRT
ncbi:hypothetical protein E4U24_005603 [Claviceps purpurea]|nr:hypothetical protein E4U24_005603 [Claviceps purpurea]